MAVGEGELGGARHVDEDGPAVPFPALLAPLPADDQAPRRDAGVDGQHPAQAHMGGDVHLPVGVPAVGGGAPALVIVEFADGRVAACRR